MPLNLLSGVDRIIEAVVEEAALALAAHLGSVDLEVVEVKSGQRVSLR
jgi:hypothetical protein